MYGAMNWFDLSAAACGEMVFELIARARRAADAGDRDARLHRHPHRHRRRSTTRTSRRARSTSAGSASRPASTRRRSRAASSTATTSARLKLFGAVLQPDATRSDAAHRHASTSTSSWPRECGGTYEDTEGLINLPLTVKDIHGGRVLQGERPRRLARQHAIEGRRRRQRHRQGVRRRRPQERVGLQRARRRLDD